MGILALAIIMSGLIIVGVMYNTLVRRRNEVENATGSVGVYLKKRADLIPSLVASVAEYAKHESETMGELTKLRSQFHEQPKDLEKMVESDALFSKLMSQVSLVVENYPDLKANTNFLNLQNSLNEVEEQVSAARRTYNANVTRYNNAVQMLPTNIVAGVFGYKVKPVFEVSLKDRQVPDIQALFKAAS